MMSNSFSKQFSVDRDFPAFEGKQHGVLIASTPRSGSNLLGQTLWTTGKFGDPLEYLHDMHFAVWSNRFDTTHDPKATIESIIRHRTSPNGVFAIKAHYPQTIEFGGPQAVVDQFGLKKAIVITRYDKLAQAISLTIAKQTNCWISFDAPQKEPQYNENAINHSFMQIIRQEMMWMNYMKNANMPYKMVLMEDFLANPDRVIREIFDFTGVSLSNDDKCQFVTSRQSNHINDEWYKRYHLHRHHHFLKKKKLSPKNRLKKMMNFLRFS